MLEVATEHAEMGFFPIPAQVNVDSCEISAKWQKHTTWEQWGPMFSKNNGLAVACGERGGNLVVIDVDQKHDPKCTLSARFIERLKEYFPDLFDYFYIEETRSGGLHIFYRIEGKVGGKEEPAKTLDYNKEGKLKEYALVEVLGEGNIVFTHPTPKYTVRQGDKFELPTLTLNEHAELIEHCKWFHELPDNVEEQDFVYDHDIDTDDRRPGSIFNRQCDVDRFAQWLCQKGWQVHKRLHDKYWLTRPGKKEGVSATWNHDGRKLLCVFSSSTEFKTTINGRQKGYTPFAVFAKIEFNDDFKAATAKLVENGFVDLDAWEEVQPLEQAKAEPFPISDMLPDNCHEFEQYIEEVSAAYQVHPEMVLMPAISAMSLALCGAVKLRVLENWEEDAPLWSIVIAEASERKSPVLKEVMGPIYQYFENFGNTHKREISALARRKRGLDAALEKAERDHDKCLTKGEGDIDAVKTINEIEDQIDAMPPIIQMPNLVQNDITPEALVKQIQANGEVCGVISAEADPIEVALGLYSDKPNFTIYLKGYSVERYTSNRVGGGETVIEQPRVVLSVMMQRDPMLKLAENRQARKRGFIARTLFAVPQSKVGARDIDTVPISLDAKGWWRFTIDRVLTLPHRLRLYESIDGVTVHSDDPAELTLTDGAKELLWMAREQNERELAPGGDHDDDTGWGGKLIGNICRVAMVLHFIGGKKITDPIDAETMISSIAWIKPLTEHYYCAQGEVGDLGVDKVVRATLVKMRDHGVQDGVRLNDLYNIVRTKAMPKAEQWQPIWDRMEYLHLIRVTKVKGKSGPPRKIVKLNPNIWGAIK